MKYKSQHIALTICTYVLQTAACNEAIQEWTIKFNFVIKQDHYKLNPFIWLKYWETYENSLTDTDEDYNIRSVNDNITDTRIIII